MSDGVPASRWVPRMTVVDPDNEATFDVCVIPSDLRETCVPKRAIVAELERLSFDEEATFAIKLALEEALTNAVKHGNRNDATKTVTVRYAITADKAVVIVRDEGVGFLPENVPDCTSPDRLRVPNGRGIMLMRAYMDEVCYRDRGREVYFVKSRSGPHRTPDASPKPAVIRRTLHYTGHVQAVGFRYTTQGLAARFAVTGFVRNLPDGRVELVVEGAEPELDRFSQAVHAAMQGYIRKVSSRDEPATGEFTAFRITR